MAKNLGEVKQESPHLHLVLALHQDSSSLKARADVAIPSAEQWAEILSKLSYGREQASTLAQVLLTIQHRASQQAPLLSWASGLQQGLLYHPTLPVFAW